MLVLHMKVDKVSDEEDDKVAKGTLVNVVSQVNLCWVGRSNSRSCSCTLCMILHFARSAHYTCTCSNTHASMCRNTRASTCRNTRASTCRNTRASTCRNTCASTCRNTRASPNCWLICASTCRKARASTCRNTRASTCRNTRASLLFKNMPPGFSILPAKTSWGWNAISENISDLVLAVFLRHVYQSSWWVSILDIGSARRCPSFKAGYFLTAAFSARIPKSLTSLHEQWASNSSTSKVFHCFGLFGIYNLSWQIYHWRRV